MSYYKTTYLESVAVLETIIWQRLVQDFSVSEVGDKTTFFNAAYLEAVVLFLSQHGASEDLKRDMTSKSLDLFNAFIDSAKKESFRAELSDLLRMVSYNLFSLYKRIMTDIYMDDDRFRVGGMVVPHEEWLGPFSAFKQFLLNGEEMENLTFTYGAIVRKYFREVVCKHDERFARIIDSERVMDVRFKFA